jgi:hypothetical protein
MGGKITMDGQVRTRFNAHKDTVKDQAVIRENDTLVRLGLTANLSDTVTGRIHLESGDGQNYSYAWGEPTDGSGLFDGGSKKGAMNILEAWAQYVPGNWGVKVGHMPLALGDMLFFDHTEFGDDAVVAWINPAENIHIAGLFIKFIDEANPIGPTGGPDVVADEGDINGYVGLGTMDFGNGMKGGVNWTYLTSKKNSATTGGVAGAFPLSEMSFSNVGVTFDAMISNIGVKLDVEKQFGDVTNVGGTSIGAEGWAAQGEASMGMGNFTLGALVGYGSGEDYGSANNDVEEYINFLSNVRYQSTLLGYIQAVPQMGGQKHTGLANLLLFQVNAATDTKCPISGKDLNLKAVVNYAMLNETPADTPTVQVDDQVGTEVELFATWRLDNGLSLGFEGAYLFAGDAYKTDVDALGNPIALGDPDNAWFTRAALNLSF